MTTDTTIGKIGPYVLESEIGAGAHGKVFRAHHSERSDEQVALKVIENRGNLDRLMLEPQILSKLRHPGIVGLFDYFTNENRLVVALEFLDGKDLKDYSLAHGPSTVGEVRVFLRQMASALKHAHAAGILHRDIKPANILVVESEQGPRYVLTDFGISRISDGLQVSRHTGGTYQFMAPEQLRGRPTEQSDLWALGVVAYQMLTGKLPFAGDTVKELAAEVLYKTPLPLSDELGTHNDEELAAIIYELLEKQPANRTGSAAILLDKLGGELSTKLDQTPRKTSPKMTIDQQSQKKIRRYTIGCVLSGLLWSGPVMVVVNIIVLAGLWCFYKGQRAIFNHQFGKGSGYTLGGLALLAVSWFFKSDLLIFGLLSLNAIGIETGKTGESIAVLWILNSYVIVVFSLIFTPLAAYLFSIRRRLLRERGLRRAISEGNGDANHQLDILGSMAQERSTDLVTRQKYAEALLAHDRPKDAVVEAKLMLDEDPYNIAAGLLLAHGYFDLGLYDLTTNVCDTFLEVAGYCFEFRELKEQASQLTGAST